MKYTEKDLYDFMETERVVRVTSVSGKVYTGQCWAYCAVVCEEEYGRRETRLEVGLTVLWLSEIAKIEFAD